MSEPNAPHVPAIAAVRRQALRHHLINEVARPARRRRRMLVLAPVVGVLATAVAAGAIAQPWAPNSAPLIVAVEQGEHAGATLFLHQMATATAEKPGPGEGEYVYIKSRVAFAEFGDGPARLQPVHEREIWIPRYEQGDGLLRQPYFVLPIIGAIPPDRPGGVSPGTGRRGRGPAVWPAGCVGRGRCPG